jgi:hypothetical protein
MDVSVGIGKRPMNLQTDRGYRRPLAYIPVPLDYKPLFPQERTEVGRVISGA